MIELTEQQLRILEQHEAHPLRAVDPKTHKRFVVLSDEAYQRLTDYDSSPWTDEERDLLRGEAVEALGWEGMQAYQDD